MDLLEQRERQLDLILALDKVRDALEINEDPHAMFNAIIGLLREYFNADVCAMMLNAEAAPDEIEALVYSGIQDEDEAIRLCRQSMKMSKPGEIKNTTWKYNLGIHIIQDEEGESLGGLFLARLNATFSQADADLLEVAEHQIDSAVIQARKIWNLAQQNMQLEAIYQIDRMRDDNPEEGELINNFTGMLAEYFGAELVLVFLSHMDDGDLILRGMIDKDNVPYTALSTLEKLTDSITVPTLLEPPEHLEHLKLLAAPIIVAGVQLGSAIIGRRPSFTIAHQRLLYAMMSQMDSAIVHCRVVNQLIQRNKELQTIYRIDKIRDSEIDFEIMLQKVLTELCHAVDSEMGYLMLYRRDGEERLQLQATTANAPLSSPAYFDTIKAMSRRALDEAHTVHSNRPNGAIRSIVSIPLILNEQIIGVFGVINSSKPRGFSAEDVQILTAITSQVDTAVFERLERRRMRSLLSRSVDPKVLNHMLRDADAAVLQGERVILTTLFADLRGSTQWAEEIDPEELVHTLNLFLARMTEVIFEFGGTLDKFVGDEVIALFGTPVPMDDHAATAARCAIKMQQEHLKLQQEVAGQGRNLPPMGVGISSGEVIAGEFGPPVRTDFTAMGRVMNLGARLCSSAGPGQIYISKATHELLGTQAEIKPLDPVGLKGIGQVEVCELISFN